MDSCDTSDAELVYKNYEEQSVQWMSKNTNIVGSFSLTTHDLFYALSQEVPLPHVQFLPEIKLPLCLHICRGRHFGCSMENYKETCEEMLTMINSYWKAARIEWQLVDVVEEHFEHLLNTMAEGERIAINKYL